MSFNVNIQENSQMMPLCVQFGNPIHLLHFWWHIPRFKEALFKFKDIFTETIQIWLFYVSVDMKKHLCASEFRESTEIDNISFNVNFRKLNIILKSYIHFFLWDCHSANRFCASKMHLVLIYQDNKIK